VRLPFPERVPIMYAFLFAAGLSAIQLSEGTNPAFSLGCFGFIVIAAVAFNFAGGFSRPSGAYVFFYATLTIIVGICWKAFLGEPADSNLEDPLLIIYAFLASICMVFVAVLISRKLVTKRAILGGLVNDGNMQTATIGCLITGLILTVILMFSPVEGGSVLSALNQLNRFLPMAVILGVIHVIRRSGGTRSVSLPVLLAAGFMFAGGILSFSKEGMLAPIACWVIAASSQRYRVSRSQLIGGILVVIFIFRYLVPYSQYGREFHEDTFSGNLSASISMLSNLQNVREQYLLTSEEASEEEDMAISGYYNTPQGFFDRLQVFAIDGALIVHTQQFGALGYYPIIEGFENLLPHFIWKDKPFLRFGNMYAHELGLLAEDDTSTGISFSPTAEAFHLGGWTGIFLLAPALWILLFVVFDSLCGDVRRSPWGLLASVSFGHLAPEGGLNGIIYCIGYLNVAIIFAALMGAYLMPIIGTLFIGPEAIQLRRSKAIRSIPKALIPPSPSES
jgi:hypothetical protein